MSSEEPLAGRTPDDPAGDTPADRAGTSGATDLPEPDGLELARAIARSTAGGPAKKAKQRRRPRPTGNRVAGAHPDDRDPQLLDGLVSRLVEDHGWGLPLRVHAVIARWGEIVGEDIAGHTAPESFADGRLTVRTDSTAWATQLKLLVPTLLTRLNEELGQGTVAFIDVEGPTGPSWRKGRLRTRDSRGPRDTYG